MVSIVVAAVKGGVGKSTLSVGLAETLSRAAGSPCLLLDLDPQGSATRWADSGELESTVTPVIARSAGQLPRLIRAHQGTHDWIIVDTPPGDVAIIDAAIGEGDLIVIPTKPTTMDLPQTVETYAMAEGVASVAVLNQVQANTSAPAAAREALNDAGLRVADTEVRHWQAIAQLAGGRWPTSGRVNEIFDQLGDELLEELT